MSNRTVPDTAGAVEATQAHIIIELLSRWLASAPGRSLRVTYTLDGWRAQLEERHPSRGDTLVDALSQIATVVALESAL